MDLSNQRRMASEILKCGQNRIYMNPNNLEDISEAVTRGDIRKLIKEDVIKARQERGISSGRKKERMKQKEAGKRKGHGSRKGSKYARSPKKRRWIQTIRPIRRTLKDYRSDGTISSETYRYYYKHASGGIFRSVGHMRSHMQTEKLLLKLPGDKEVK
ncbi:MAG: 50S ribosomal protein L19e [Candidatus Thermoplasmatota archaeon]|nr:50S ribosomal protein L19e [Candidatus Thermoplasmatota archaeon]